MKFSFMYSLFVSCFVSCVSESGLKGRKAVKDFTKLSASVGGCGEDLFVLNTTDTCTNICGEGSHIASTQEITDAIDSLQNKPDDILDIIENSKGACIEDVVKIIRPSEVYVNRNFCACSAGKAIIVNDCQDFCRSKTEGTPYLYGSVKVGPSIELNDKMKNFAGWCLKNIGDLDDNGIERTNASCTLDVYDGVSTQSLPFSPIANSNSFKVDISLLQKNLTYVATFKESGSGSEASSDSFQIRKIDPPSDEYENNTPLKLMPVSQYTCVTRTSPPSTDNNYLYINSARLHFYFPANGAPDPLPPGSQFTICHDPQDGTNDSPLFPRLELIPQYFSVWDQADTRFADLNNNGRPDINETIEERLLSEYGITRNINIFGLLNWQSGPIVTENQATSAPNIGFFMVPWVDQVSGRAFCPTQQDYNGTDRTFNILKDIIRNDTEGLFIAKKEPIALTDSDGNIISAPDDYIFIRENLLKKIWFYSENGQTLVPNEDTASQKTIHFYYPPDTVNPLTKKSTQKTYTIKDPATIGQQGGATGLQTQITPADKRFGCIPALD